MIRGEARRLPGASVADVRDDLGSELADARQHLKDETLAMYVGQHRVVWRLAREQVEALEQALGVQEDSHDKRPKST